LNALLGKNPDHAVGTADTGVSLLSYLQLNNFNSSYMVESLECVTFIVGFKFMMQMRLLTLLHDITSALGSRNHSIALRTFSLG
jgi:hypothetical protein